MFSKHNLNNWTTYTITPNTHYTFSTLSHNTQYDWQIRTNCNASQTIVSAFSPIQTFTTSPRLEDGEIDNTRHGFAIFPNPASNKATVEFYSENSGKFNLRLTDVTGRIIMNIDNNSVAGNNQFELDLSSISSGIYLVTLNEGDIILTSKIAVK